MKGRAGAEPGPGARVVVIGASNVARSGEFLVRRLQPRLAGPADFYLVGGLGRSFGLHSTVVWRRTLPPILECGLWRELEVSQAPLRALVTDVGNDLLYGQQPGRIAGWVEACLERLERLGAETVLSSPPAASVAGLGPVRFRVARDLIFPGRDLTLAEVRGRVGALDRELERIAGARGVPYVRLRAGWYGLDPVHLRRASWPEAWDALTAPWGLGVGGASGRPARVPSLLAQRPEVRWLLGRRLERSQPAVRLASGGSVSLY